MNINYNEIFLEVTNICNFNCLFCTYDLMKRKQGFMDVKLFKRLIDEISKSKKVEKVLFCVMGEPLLHPHIMDMISYTTKKISRQILITNSSMLQSEKK